MVAEAETRRHFCGCTERIGGGEIARWHQPAWNGGAWVGEPRRRVLKWTLHSSVPASYKAAIAWAWAQWEKVCAITPVYVESIPEADIVYTAANIDGPFGTLAWAELPFGPDRQHESRIDTSENWHLVPGTPAPQGKTRLDGPICHEVGHSLGLEHDNSPDALMYKEYGRLNTPQPRDIKQAVLRYGDAFDATPPTTPTPTPTPGAKPAVIEIDGVKWTGTLTRVA